MAGNEIETTGS